MFDQPTETVSDRVIASAALCDETENLIKDLIDMHKSHDPTPERVIHVKSLEMLAKVLRTITDAGNDDRRTLQLFYALSR